ncbi:MAG: hypothetical protein U1F77_02685 [Kiritimatiellia bacterium]
MKTLEQQVVNALIDAGVNAVVSCRREKFDVPVAASSGSPETAPAPKAAVAAPALDANTFTISFQSSEPVAWSAISKLQNLPMAPVVTWPFRTSTRACSSSRAAALRAATRGSSRPVRRACRCEPADNKPIDPLAARKLVAGRTGRACVTLKVYQLPPSAKHSGK